MRLLPQSLFSRLILILLGGLILAQVLSLAVQLRERGELIYRSSGLRSAQRIADIVRLLEATDAAERHHIAAVFDAPPLQVALASARVALPAPEPENEAHTALFSAVLQSALGDATPVEVVVTAIPLPARIMAPRGPGVPGKGAVPGMSGGLGMGGGPGYMRGIGPAVMPGPGLSYIAQVHLRDGMWATFDARQPQEAFNWPYRVLLTVVILLVAVVLLSLIAVRLVTRPLNALADAAEQLGRDINRPPLAESGPLEVRRAARAFNTMQARLVRYIQDRTRVLAAMSHDLKTPITRLRLRAELLDDDENKIKFTRDLEEMEAMVGATLDFMRGLETGEALQPVDIMSMLESIQEDARETGGAVTISGAASGALNARPQALKRCLRNLVDNAIQYGKSAHIVVEDQVQSLVIRIRDAGPGIPEQELKRVFEPFYRLEASRNRESGGTGLGLTIALSVASAHGGDLALANLPGGGLEAVLTFPRAPAVGRQSPGAANSLPR